MISETMFHETAFQKGEEQKMKKSSNVETTTLHPVPPEEKKNWVTVMLIQAGAQICVPSLLLGGLLVEAMPLKEALIAGFIGYAGVALLISLIGVIGAELSVPTCVVTKGIFGNTGSRVVISTLFTLTMVGWFAIQNTVCGEAFTNFMSNFGISIPVWVSSIIWGIIMMVTAVYGVNALDKLNVVAIPALMITMIYGTYKAISAYGSDTAFAAKEITMSMPAAIVMVISFSACAICTCCDFSRYQKTRKDTALANSIGIAGGGYLVLVLGAVMSAITKQYDITAVLMDLGLVVLGMIILILATWTTNTVNSYASGINLVMLLNAKDDKRAMLTLVAGAVSTIAAVLGLLGHLEGFITWLGNLYMPLIGAMIADYWIIQKAKAENFRFHKSWDWVGILSVAVGLVVAVTVPYGLPAIQGGVVSFIVIIILRKCTKDTRDQVVE